MCEQKFAFSLVVFCSNAAISISFFGSYFFPNGFPNPLIVHSRPSFLFEPDFYFSLVVFCLHAAV